VSIRRYIMLNPIQSNSNIAHQSSAVTNAIKDAKPDLVSIDAGGSTGAKAGDASTGKGDFKPPPKGIDLSV
jgi:hypothetical protein